MPWKGKTVEELREEFYERAKRNEMKFSKLCEEYGISRTTGYAWVERIENGEGLSDRSRKPLNSPNKIPQEMEDKIVDFRKKYPAIGAVKIHKMMENEGEQNLPSVSTFNNIFHRNNLITKEASRAAAHYQRFEMEAPNDMWQGDFKGDFLLGNKTRCFPLSVIDDCSRFCLSGEAQTSVKYTETMPSFENIFREYGMPKTFLCDNGNPWGNSQTRCITKFEVAFMDLDILTIHTRIKHPQCQGKVEHFNGSYKREWLKFYLPENIADAKKSREEYRYFYNNVRPHSALDLKVPAEIYVPSCRKYPDKIETWEYESDTVLRKVKSSGYVDYKGLGYFLSEGLEGRVVGFMPTSTDGILKVVYRGFRVALLDLHHGTVIQRRIYRLHDDQRLKDDDEIRPEKPPIDNVEAK